MLGGIPYSLNDVYLHTDPTLMPRNKDCWASWNCLEDEASRGAEGAAGEQGGAALGATRRAVCVTYWLNHLQNLPSTAPTLLCTLNPIKPPEEGSVLKHLQLAHPVFGPSATASQAKLPSIQVRAPQNARLPPQRHPDGDDVDTDGDDFFYFFFDNRAMISCALIVDVKSE